MQIRHLRPQHRERLIKPSTFGICLFFRVIHPPDQSTQRPVVFFCAVYEENTTVHIVLGTRRLVRRFLFQGHIRVFRIPRKHQIRHPDVWQL